jgi:hypothetical protein
MKTLFNKYGVQLALIVLALAALLAGSRISQISVSATAEIPPAATAAR